MLLQLALVVLCFASGRLAAETRPFVHPGMLHTQADFDRMSAKVARHEDPWWHGWKKLTDNNHSSPHWIARPQEFITRGGDSTHLQNYPLLYNDIAAAYALALRWKVSGDEHCARKAVEILNGWAASLKGIGGTNDKFLAAGLYGYEFANAAEIMRTYPGWSREDQGRFQQMMLTVFYPMNHDFLLRHNNAKIDHYWANWDLCNLASVMAIGILTDRRDLYDDAVEYFKHGEGNGAIHKLVWKVYPEGLGQIQESGRDQGHTMLDLGLVGAICQMAWNQGDDLFGYENNLLLKGIEYAAKYNLGKDVPYTPYTNSDVTQNAISDHARGDDRPIWELLYNHYVVLKGLSAPYTTQYLQRVRKQGGGAEGGGGDYGPNSGGYDQLGYGTLAYALQ